MKRDKRPRSDNDLRTADAEEARPTTPVQSTQTRDDGRTADAEAQTDGSTTTHAQSMQCVSAVNIPTVESADSGRNAVAAAAESAMCDEAEGVDMRREWRSSLLRAPMHLSDADLAALKAQTLDVLRLCESEQRRRAASNSAT